MRRPRYPAPRPHCCRPRVHSKDVPCARWKWWSNNLSRHDQRRHCSLHLVKNRVFGEGLPSAHAERLIERCLAMGVVCVGRSDQSGRGTTSVLARCSFHIVAQNKNGIQKQASELTDLSTDHPLGERTGRTRRVSHSASCTAWRRHARRISTTDTIMSALLSGRQHQGRGREQHGGGIADVASRTVAQRASEFDQCSVRGASKNTIPEPRDPAARGGAGANTVRALSVEGVELARKPGTSESHRDVESDRR